MRKRKRESYVGLPRDISGGLGIQGVLIHLYCDKQRILMYMYVRKYEYMYAQINTFIHNIHNMYVC